MYCVHVFVQIPALLTHINNLLSIITSFRLRNSKPWTYLHVPMYRTHNNWDIISRGRSNCSKFVKPNQNRVFFRVSSSRCKNFKTNFTKKKVEQKFKKRMKSRTRIYSPKFKRLISIETMGLIKLTKMLKTV